MRTILKYGGLVPRTPRSNPLSICLAVAVAATVALLSACGDGSGSGSGSADGGGGGGAVVATTPIWADVTSNLLCGEVRVDSIVPVGADSHSFEPSVQDADALRSVDLVVANGLGLEEGLHGTLTAAQESGATVLEVAPSLDPLDGHDHGDEPDHDEPGHDEPGHDDEYGHEVDPHVWMDPERVAAAVPLIVEELKGLDGLPVDAAQIERCAADYVDELGALVDEMDEVLATVPEASRRLVTNHESLGYFADRFGFEVVGAVVPSTSSLGEASARDLDDLAETMRDAGVTTIFAETTGSTEVSDGLAERLGPTANVVELSVESTGDDTGDAGTYVEMMRTNAALIAEHLGGSVPR